MASTRTRADDPINYSQSVKDRRMTTIPEPAMGMQVASPAGELLVFTPNGWVASAQWYAGCIPVAEEIFQDLKKRAPRG